MAANDAINCDAATFQSSSPFTRSNRIQAHDLQSDSSLDLLLVLFDDPRKRSCLLPSRPRMSDLLLCH